ncbi:MAG TPA: ribbon-helix-helix domain-containing protein [Thermoanaerobaculia bacterium]|nr:ribbon-helix-helix domain-containing protein [Thermoanaerobaculia bacterium]
MAKKVTFTLDDQTVKTIDVMASQLGKPKSQVVREAVADYHERAGRLSESERQRLLAAMDRMMAMPPTRPSSEVDREMARLRAARRAGGRRSPQ